MWSLLSLLIAICGLLASPNVEDPLIPEIGQKYVEDPDDFYEIAKKWTAEYAKASVRPDEESLRFPDEPSAALEVETTTEPTHESPENDLQYSSSAMQQYLRFKYDEKFDQEWVRNSDSFRQSSFFTRISDPTVTIASSEFGTIKPESEDSRTEALVDSLLLLDAEQSHLRQMTGECFSKIEQWRMVREVRLALERQIDRSPLSATSKGNPKFMADARIRTLVRESAIRLFDPTAPETLRQYLITLMTTFSKVRSFMLTPAKTDEHSRPIVGTQDGSIDSTADLEQATVNTSLSLEGTISLVPSRATVGIGNSIPAATEVGSSILKPVLDSAVEEQPASRSSVSDSPPELATSTEDPKPSENDHVHISRPSPYSPLTLNGEVYGIFNESISSTVYFSKGFSQQKPRSSTRYHSRYSPQALVQDSSRAFSPRYTSTGDYAATANRQQNSWSAPRSETRRRSSYSRKSYGESEEDEVEYVDYLVEGRIYRVPSQQPRRPGEYGTDHYYYSLGQYASDRPTEPEYRRPSPRRRRQSSSAPQRPRSARPTVTPKKPPTIPKATEADARKHRIPPGYSLKNWDPSEEPIMLLGSVFDANSLGKWIYDWTVYHHGPATPLADMAGEHWLLLIQLAGKMKKAEECLPAIRMNENREMVEDFIESGERLMNKLRKLLKACETHILKATKKTPGEQLGKNAGTEFVDSIFGRDRQLEATEKLMTSVRLWILRFDANCEDILRRPGQYTERDFSNSTFSNIIMAPVAIRTAFGLEDIPELVPTINPVADTARPEIDTKKGIVKKSMNAETEQRKSIGTMGLGISVDKSYEAHPVAKETNVTSPDGAAPLSSVASLDDEDIFWAASRKGKTNTRKTSAEKTPDVDVKGIEQQAVLGHGWDFGPYEAKETKEDDPTTKTKIDEDWGAWGFGRKKNLKKGKGKLPTVRSSEEGASAVNPEQKEGLNHFEWGSYIAREDKKTTKSTGEKSKEDDTSSKPEKKEEPDDLVFDFGFVTTKKDKKKTRKKSNTLDAETNLQEGGLVPNVMHDPVSKQERDAGWDWDWKFSAWGTTEKGEKKEKESDAGWDWSAWGTTEKSEKKEKEKEGGSAEDGERDAHTGITEALRVDATGCM